MADVREAAGDCDGVEQWGKPVVPVEQVQLETVFVLAVEQRCPTRLVFPVPPLVAPSVGPK